MASKLIFLDIYGVLTVTGNKCSYCVRALNLTDAVKANIVISSSFKYEGLPYCAKMLRDWGVTGRVVDVTGTSDSRSMEINDYLSIYDADAFVVIDDQLMHNSLVPNFIWTDPEFGFTMQDAEAAIRILSK
jgi:hypothetical protein